MQKIYSKIGSRQSRRIKQRLHIISKFIILVAKKRESYFAQYSGREPKRTKNIDENYGVVIRNQWTEML